MPFDFSFTNGECKATRNRLELIAVFWFQFHFYCKLNDCHIYRVFIVWYQITCQLSYLISISILFTFLDYLYAILAILNTDNYIDRES